MQQQEWRTILLEPQAERRSSQDCLQNPPSFRDGQGSKPCAGVVAAPARASHAGLGWVEGPRVTQF